MERKQPAGFGSRLLASFLDSLILVSVIGLLYFAITGEFSTDWADTLEWQLLYTFYLIITPLIWSGYVLGKRICKIKVHRYEDGGQVKLSNMILREFVGYYLLSIVSFGVTIIVSIFMVIFREDKRAIHDFIGGTQVIKAETSYKN
ncbi:RDD family protein [Halobacillus sp. KGW1]|uniref:RDD family protein n=1 Tax=Halobacillus sp. KGW1 TaxID=1793726 RepID=UPI000782D62C|nr:RDD family protein [Halobacillus sp. KGW1]